MPAKVSVVVCAHSLEREPLLRKALNSLRTQQSAPLEVVVVIDHNPSLFALISADYPDFRVLENENSRGLSGARNTGVVQALGDVIAFIDDDAEATPDWVARLILHYQNKQVIGVGGYVAPIWPAQRPSWFPRQFDWVVGCSYTGLPDSAAEVRNLIGCNMSFRRSVFEKVGAFAEALGRNGADAAGCEETEFSIRARRGFPGSIVLYDPSVRVSHNVSQDRCSFGYFGARCWAEGVSKAKVAARVGATDALKSELRYVTHTLPAGIFSGFKDALQGDLAGLGRSIAIGCGFAITTLGYAVQKLRRRRGEVVPFLPIKVLDLDRTKPLPPVGSTTDAGSSYGGIFCLVREQGEAVGVAELELDGGSALSQSGLAALIQQPGRARRRKRPPTATAPFVSVVVATRDRPTSLSVCIESLLVQDYPGFEIVVVDNAPRSNETANLIADRYASTGRVRYVRDDQPGLGRAHNSGLSVITSPIVAFTDDDVVVDHRWLSAISSAFQSAANVGCVTGLILPAELETRAQLWTERHGGFGKGFERRIFDLDQHRPTNSLFPYAAGQFGSGANMAFQTEALRRIGGFDPALGAGTLARGGDDLAAFFSIINSRHQLVYEPQAIVWHYHRRSEDGMRRQAYGYGVGLGAYLTKLVLDEPRVLFRLIAAFPAGLKHMFGAAAPRNKRLPSDYPRSLIWRERLGIVAGVPAYVRSRRAARRAAGFRLKRG